MVDEHFQRNQVGITAVIEESGDIAEVFTIDTEIIFRILQENEQIKWFPTDKFKYPHCMHWIDSWV